MRSFVNCEVWRQLTSFTSIFILLHLISTCCGRALPWPNDQASRTSVRSHRNPLSRYVEPVSDQAGTELASRESDLSLPGLQEDIRALTSQLDEARTQVQAMRDEIFTLGSQVGTLQSQVDVLHHHRRTAPTMTCRANYTPWIEAIGKTLEYLHGFHIHCGHGEFLRTWEMSWGELKGMKRIRFVCCRFQHR